MKNEVEILEKEIKTIKEKLINDSTWITNPEHKRKEIRKIYVLNKAIEIFKSHKS